MLATQKVTLYNGDCLEEMKKIPPHSVDMILCDLPYGTTQNKWDTVIPFEPLWEQYRRIVKHGGAIVLFGNQPFTSAVVASNVKQFRYSLVWDKRNAVGFLNANRMPLRRHEDILVFYDKLPTYNPQFWFSTPYTSKCRSHTSNYGKYELTETDASDGRRFPTSVLAFAKPCGKDRHPTQKPVPLLEYLIRTYTNDGETVLDNCMGSGSTGVACINTGRSFIGIEKDEKWFRFAKNRIQGGETRAET